MNNILPQTNILKRFNDQKVPISIIRIIITRNKIFHYNILAMTWFYENIDTTICLNSHFARTHTHTHKKKYSYFG